MFLFFLAFFARVYMLEVSICPGSGNDIVWVFRFIDSLRSFPFHQEKSRKISADGDVDQKMQWSQHMIHELLAMCFAWNNGLRHVKG